MTQKIRYQEEVGIVSPGEGEASPYQYVEVVSIQLGYTTNAEAGIRAIQIGMYETANAKKSILFDSYQFEAVSTGYFFVWVQSGVSAYEGAETSAGQPHAQYRPLPAPGSIYVPRGWTVGITLEGKKGTDSYKPRIAWRGYLG